MTGLGMRERDALLTAIRRATWAMKAATPEGAFEMATARLGRLLHAHHLEQRYNPNWPSQPRVPRGNADGGRWTDGGEELEPSEFEEAVAGKPTGDRPPKIPRTRPTDPDLRNGTIRGAAAWARTLARFGGPLGAFMSYIDTTWLRTDLNEIEAYLDEPKTLEELHAAVDEPRKGTHVHHIVEQGPARKTGRFSREQIHGRANKVRIPTLIHREITNWYNTKNEDYGGKTLRQYLQDKSWEERMDLGLQKLWDFGMLVP